MQKFHGRADANDDVFVRIFKKNWCFTLFLQWCAICYGVYMPRLREPQRWWTVPGPGAPSFPTGDELFTHLDGRFVRVGSMGWRVEIYSVWAEDMRWVQLSLRGPSEHMLVLRVPLAANAAEILGEIEQWLRNPATVDS